MYYLIFIGKIVRIATNTDNKEDGPFDEVARISADVEIITSREGGPLEFKSQKEAKAYIVENINPKYVSPEMLSTTPKDLFLPSRETPEPEVEPEVEPIIKPKLKRSKKKGANL